MDTQQAIQTHGATTVYYAAVRATEGDTQALSSVGIENERAWAQRGALCRLHIVRWTRWTLFRIRYRWRHVWLTSDPRPRIAVNSPAAERVFLCLNIRLHLAFMCSL